MSDHADLLRYLFSNKPLEHEFAELDEYEKWVRFITVARAGWEAADRIEELETKVEMLVHERDYLAGLNERLRTGHGKIIEFGSDIVAVTIADEALSAAQENDDE